MVRAEARLLTGGIIQAPQAALHRGQSPPCPSRSHGPGRPHPSSLVCDSWAPDGCSLWLLGEPRPVSTQIPTWEAGQILGCWGSLLSPQQQHCLSGAGLSQSDGASQSVAGKTAHEPSLPLAGVLQLHGSPPGHRPPLPSADGRSSWLLAPPLPQVAVGHILRDQACGRTRGVCEGLGPPSLTLGCPGWPHVPSRLWTTSQCSPACGLHEEAQSRLFCRPAEQGCTLGARVGHRHAGRLSLEPPRLLVSLLQNSGDSAGLLPLLTASSPPPQGPLI